MTELTVSGEPKRGLSRRETALVLVCLAALGIAGGVIVRELRRSSTPAVVRAAQTFHGQATWSSGSRPAPPFALRDQDGRLVSLQSLRGKPVLLVFLDSRCTSACPIAGRELGSVMRHLTPATRPAIVVVSVDPRGDTPPSIRHALAKWQLAGPWAVHWLNAPRRSQLAAVWRAYHVQVEPTTNDIVHSLALYLIDRRGNERTAYLFPFLPNFVQRDLGRLARSRA